jgi:glycosyltransferase involved in cell wall biosynthesis
MNVRILIKRFCPDEVIGGAERFAGRLAEGLTARGHHVRITSARYKSAWKKHETLPCRDGGGLRAVPVDRLPHPPARFLGTAVFNLSLLGSLIMNRAGYDIVYVCFASFEAVTAALASILTGKPVVCKIAASGRDGDIGLLSRRRFFPLAALLLRRMTCFVALNREVDLELRRIGVPASKIVCIPNGVDTDRFEPVSPGQKTLSKRRLDVEPDTPVIVAVGRLARQKSFETLIRALADLPAGLRWRAFILGQGAQLSFLEAEIEQHRLADRLTITIEPDDIGRYLSAADIFVLPSRWEGLSNALLEAMASGLACLCSDIPGNNDVVESGSNGILFRAEDHWALAAALERLLRDPALMETLGERARRSVRDHYSIRTVVESYLDLFERLRRDHLAAREPADTPAAVSPLPRANAKASDKPNPEKAHETEYV